jgi:hypothetical protein
MLDSMLVWNSGTPIHFVIITDRHSVPQVRYFFGHCNEQIPNLLSVLKIKINKSFRMLVMNIVGRHLSGQVLLSVLRSQNRIAEPEPQGEAGTALRSRNRKAEPEPHCGVRTALRSGNHIAEPESHCGAGIALRSRNRIAEPEPQGGAGTARNCVFIFLAGAEVTKLWHYFYLQMFSISAQV